MLACLGVKECHICTTLTVKLLDTKGCMDREIRGMTIQMPTYHQKGSI